MDDAEIYGLYSVGSTRAPELRGELPLLSAIPIPGDLFRYKADDDQVGSFYADLPKDDRADENNIDRRAAVAGKACRQRPAVSIASRKVNLREACAVLESWDLHANTDSRGAHLFRQMLAQAHGNQFSRQLPASFTPALPFDVADPVNTPRGLSGTAADAVLEALAKAVLQLQRAGLPLDAELGEIQTVTRNGERIPLHGGPEIEGIFNKIEAEFQGAAGYPEVSRWSSSWIMATAFTTRGPRARGILTYSLSANPESPWYRDQTEMFSNKQWLDLPFTVEDVKAASIQSYDLKSEYYH